MVPCSFCQVLSGSHSPKQILPRTCLGGWRTRWEQEDRQDIIGHRSCSGGVPKDPLAGPNMGPGCASTFEPTVEFGMLQ